MTEWQKRTHALSWLKKQAFDHRSLDNQMVFLKAVGVVPEDVEFRGRNWLPSTNLPAAAIPARYIAEVANEWDEMGPSSPVDFIHALSFECAGTTQRDEVADVLASLGAFIQQENALAAA